MNKLKKSDKEILMVSGTHRSGTTWVGKIIANATNNAYIHEPFNINIHNTPFEEWFYYIRKNELNKSAYNYINSYLDNNIKSYLDTLKMVNSAHDIYYFYKKITNGLFSNNSYIIKDPIAFFSLPWIYNNFNTKNIILIRHPAAFAASLKVKKWNFDFCNFLHQRDLMNDHINPFLEEINRVKKNPNIIDESILLWKIFHTVILKYRKENPDWVFIKHEDLSADPYNEFEKIFNKLNLQIPENLNKTINLTISDKVKNSVENSSKVKNVKRNSAENILYWKKRLDRKEIKYIRNKVEEISVHFYSDIEW